MPRTTIDIDSNVLRHLKRRQQREGKSLGRLVSELLTSALTDDEGEASPLEWTTRAMLSRVNLEDKEAVRRALDEE